MTISNYQQTFITDYLFFIIMIIYIGIYFLRLTVLSVDYFYIHMVL